MNRRYMLLILTLPLFFTNMVCANSITKSEFLRLLEQSHPLFQKEDLNSTIEKEAQAAYLGAEDWNLSSSVAFVHDEPALAYAGPERTDALTISGTAQRKFWKTGGTITASYSSTRFDMKLDPFYRVPSSFYQHQIGIAYMHPLMRNKKGFLDQFAYKLKSFAIDFSEVTADERKEDFLAQSALTYLQWVYLNEQVNIIAERLKLSEEELERTKKKREANLIDQADVIRAEDAVNLWKQNLALVQSQERSIRASLSILSQQPDLTERVPADDLYTTCDVPTVREAENILTTQSRLVKRINIQIKQLAYSKLGFEETLKPDLTLVASLNTKRADEGIGTSLVLNKPTAEISLLLNVPIGNRTSKANIEKTDIQTAQLEQAKKELILELLSNYTRLRIQISEFERIMELNRDQIISATKRTEEELKLYEQGRGELTFVIQSRDNEQNVQLSYAQNALAYQQLVVQADALLDRLYNATSDGDQN